MPLDANGKKYAELLYFKQLETIQTKQAQEMGKVVAEFCGRSTLPSGAYLSARARVIGTHVGLMAEARARTLLQAYERAGQSLNASTLQEISAEINLFRKAKKVHLHQAAHNLVLQNFQNTQQSGLVNALAAQMETELARGASRALRDLSIKHHEILLDKGITGSTENTNVASERYDVFISHASEDKESFVLQLAESLISSGVQVWFDKTELTIGDSLRVKIDEGLSRSRWGIVVLSPNFFIKKWPPLELDGLVSKEVLGTKVILPIWHNIDYEGVCAHSPMLAGRLAAKSLDGVDTVVAQLRMAMGF